jgi:hypothetical protein
MCLCVRVRAKRMFICACLGVSIPIVLFHTSVAFQLPPIQSNQADSLDFLTPFQHTTPPHSPTNSHAYLACSCSRLGVRVPQRRQTRREHTTFGLDVLCCACSASSSCISAAARGSISERQRQRAVLRSAAAGDVCSRMLTYYAYACSRMLTCLTYADVCCCSGNDVC